MPPSSQRAQPRVKYPADVRLFADRLETPLVGRSRDLGPAGIFIESGQRLAVGTPVVCEVTLPSGTVRLAGLVAREQILRAAVLPPGPAGSPGSPASQGSPASEAAAQGQRIGLGIQFVNLDPAARAELEGLIPNDERARQLVAIHLEGMRDALRSQATLTSDGVKVLATLPFLREGGEVKVAFLSGAARIESRSVVRDVRFATPGEDGAPRLEMRLQFVSGATLEPPPDEPEHGKEVTEVTAVDTPSGIASAALSEVLSRDRALTQGELRDGRVVSVRSKSPSSGTYKRSPTTMSAIPIPTPRGEETAPLFAHRSHFGRFAAVAAGSVALIAFGAALNRYVSMPRQVVIERGTGLNVTSSAAPGSGTIVTPIGRPAPAPAEAAKAPAEAARAPAAAPAAPGVAVARTPHTEVPAAGAPAPAPATGAAKPASKLPVEAAATAATAAASGIPTLPIGTPGPDVTVSADEVIAVVPIAGSSAGAVHYPLTQPRGLAVDLPEGEAALPIGRHAVFNDGFRFISIRPREGGGIRIAFTYAYYTPRLIDVTIEDSLVRVRVAPMKTPAKEPAQEPAPEQ